MAVYFYFLGLILMMAFFSGIEIAFISSNRLAIDIKKKQNSIKAIYASKLLNNPKYFITTTLIGINTCYVLFGILFQNILESIDFINRLEKIIIILIESALSTFIILIFIDFIPKVLFINNSERITIQTSIPIYFFNKLLFPIVYILNKMSNFFLKTIFKINNKEKSIPYTMVDVNAFLEKYEIDNNASHQSVNKKIFNNVVNFQNSKVRESMIPRNEVIALEIGEDVNHLKKTFTETKHSRIIIYRDNIDNVVGYSYVMDMVKKQAKDIKGLLYSLPSIPESMSSKDALKILISKKKNIACVIDEYGGTAGIVTIEDLVEEIFGEINDEYDLEENYCVRVADNEYLVSGRAELNILNSEYQFNFPESEMNTLSGYLLSNEGIVPEKGTIIEKDGYCFEILSTTNKLVKKVRIITT